MLRSKGKAFSEVEGWAGIDEKGTKGRDSARKKAQWTWENGTEIAEGGEGKKDGEGFDGGPDQNNAKRENCYPSTRHPTHPTNQRGQQQREKRRTSYNNRLLHD
jgi:hypothetical protein